MRTDAARAITREMPHLHQAALELGVSQAALRSALARGPGRARMVASLIGTSEAHVTATLAAAAERGISEDDALEWLVTVDRS